LGGIGNDCCVFRRLRRKELEDSSSLRFKNVMKGKIESRINHTTAETG
jgi:hypothetical protein